MRKNLFFISKAHILVIGLLLTAFSHLDAQRQASVWHFGDGRCLDFNSGAPINVNGSQIFTIEGSASYCDPFGNLLFYTNGGGDEPPIGQEQGHIWNRNNAVMYNMQGLEGGGYSAKQSAVIVEAPDQDSVYYVFTMDQIDWDNPLVPSTIALQPNGRGLSYFTVDMRLNNGLGDVVLADQRVYAPSAEGLCAVRHANGRDFWIIVNQDSTGFGVYSLTPTGVAFSNVFPAQVSRSIIKASPNGAFVAAARAVPFQPNIFRFNNATGELSNPLALPLPNFVWSWEFSPNSRYFYISQRVNPPATTCNILRYDLQAPSIPASVSTIGTVNNLASDMQLAPDGKIYLCTFEFLAPFSSTINRINCPNTSNPTLETNLFTYSNTVPCIGLPTFPAWLFDNDDDTFVSLGPDVIRLCDVGDTLVLNAQNPGATYAWSTGSAAQTITVTEPGTYSVSVNGECGVGTDTIVVMSCFSETSECDVYEYTGSVQQWTVPAGVDTIRVKMWGGAGGGGPDAINNWGGGGGYTEASIPVTLGQVIDIYVGGGGQAADQQTGGAGGWPNGGNGGSGNRIEGAPLGAVGGSGGGGGRSEIRIGGVSYAIAGGGGGGTCNRYGGFGGGLEAEFTSTNNSFSIHGFGGTQTAGGGPGANELCGNPVSGTAGSALQGGDGATDFGGGQNDRTSGGGGGDGYFGGGGGSSHDGCFGVGSAGGGGSGYICLTCPGVTGSTLTQAFPALPGIPANETDPLLTVYPTVALGTQSENGGPGLVQICWNTNNTGCQTINVSLTVANCGTYTSAAGNNYPQTGTFTETFLAANGCDSILTINLTVNNIPNASVTTISANCDNTGGSATANVTGGTPNFTYNWSPSNAITATAANIPSGNYTVVVTDANGCIDSSAAIVGILPGPDIFVSPDNTTILLGDSVQLQAFGGNTYTWSPSSGLSCDTCANPIASPTVTTTYIVTGFDNNGCFNSAEAVVNLNSPCGEVFVPTIFSPDGNGPNPNETLCVFGNCIKQLNYEVYNRWGQKVFQSSDKISCWDGTFNGKPSESGSYVYKVYYLLNDGTSKEEAGNLTLIR